MLAFINPGLTDQYLEYKGSMAKQKHFTIVTRYMVYLRNLICRTTRYIKNNKVYERKSDVPDDMFDPMLYTKAINKSVDFIMKNFKSPKAMEKAKSVFFKEISVNNHFEEIVNKVLRKVEYITAKNVPISQEYVNNLIFNEINVTISGENENDFETNMGILRKSEEDFKSLEHSKESFYPNIEKGTYKGKERGSVSDVKQIYVKYGRHVRESSNNNTNIPYNRDSDYMSSNEFLDGRFKSNEILQIEGTSRTDQGNNTVENIEGKDDCQQKDKELESLKDGIVIEDQGFNKNDKPSGNKEEQKEVINSQTSDVKGETSLGNVKTISGTKIIINKSNPNLVGVIIATQKIQDNTDNANVIIIKNIPNSTNSLPLNSTQPTMTISSNNIKQNKDNDDNEVNKSKTLERDQSILKLRHSHTYKSNLDKTSANTTQQRSIQELEKKDLTRNDLVRLIIQDMYKVGANKIDLSVYLRDYTFTSLFSTKTVESIFEELVKTTGEMGGDNKIVLTEENKKVLKRQLKSLVKANEMMLRESKSLVSQFKKPDQNDTDTNPFNNEMIKDSVGKTSNARKYNLINKKSSLFDNKQDKITEEIERELTNGSKNEFRDTDGIVNTGVNETGAVGYSKRRSMPNVITASKDKIGKNGKLAVSEKSVKGYINNIEVINNKIQKKINKVTNKNKKEDKLSQDNNRVSELRSDVRASKKASRRDSLLSVTKKLSRSGHGLSGRCLGVNEGVDNNVESENENNREHKDLVLESVEEVNAVLSQQNIEKKNTPSDQSRQIIKELISLIKYWRRKALIVE
jgi:hypothetical protein